MGLVAGALVCIFLFGSTSTAQSLADAARQEREKRRQRCPTRVYTNEDLSRPQILDAKDRACLEAAREDGEAAPAAAPFAANAGVRPLDTGALPPLQPVVPTFHHESLIFPYESALPDFSLAEIAPYDREMKAARLAREAQLQKTIVISVQPGRSRLHAAPAPGIAPAIPEFRLQPAGFDTKLPPTPFVPSRSSDAPARVGTVPPVHIVVPASASEISNLESQTFVRVEPGDSLWKIAERHLGDGRAWRHLAAANPQLSNPNLIQPGDVLQLPSSSEISNLESEFASSTEPANGSSVRVVLGDTLWALART
ncbi:MAG: LysM peptidoglycan-binding domain-containing protein, partial [Candidatus Acidiferrales bacterium]